MHGSLTPHTDPFTPSFTCPQTFPSTITPFLLLIPSLASGMPITTHPLPHHPHPHFLHPIHYLYKHSLHPLPLQPASREPFTPSLPHSFICTSIPFTHYPFNANHFTPLAVMPDTPFFPLQPFHPYTVTHSPITPSLPCPFTGRSKHPFTSHPFSLNHS